MAGDCVRDHVQGAKNFDVPETQDDPSVGCEPAIPNLVVGTFAVLFSVTLDDYPMRQAGEVDDVPGEMVELS